MGVRLPKLKARIFDIVQRGGDYGIQGEDIRAIVWPDEQMSRNTLKAHVHQINELIEDEGYRIVGNGVGVFRLVNQRKQLR